MAYSSPIAHTIAQDPNTGGGITTSAIDTTGADFIVLGCLQYSTHSAPTDNKSNTWIELTLHGDGASTNNWIAYCQNPTVGSGHTFTLGPQYACIAVAAFSGSKATPFDVENGAGGTSTTLSTGSITPSENNELLIFTDGNLNSTNGPQTVSVGTLLDQLNRPTGPAIALAYEIQTTATARNPTFSWGGASVLVAGSIASFKAAAAPTASKYLVKPIFTLPGGMTALPDSLLWPAGIGAHALLALRRNAAITRRRMLSFLGWPR